MRVGFGIGVVAALLASAGAANSATLNVTAGGDLQAALNQAQPGDTVVLEAGATFVGNFTLPARDGSAFITVRSSTPDGLLPADGQRITPAYAPLLPKIRSANGSAAFGTAPSAHHWRLTFLEFQGNADGSGDIIALGDGSEAQSAVWQVPHDLVLDRVYVHGDPVVGQKRGIALNSASTTIINSYIVEFKAADQDSQAVAGWNGPGPYTIVNNRLEAAGENFMLGGADPWIANLVPGDVVFRQNYVTKPSSWQSGPWIVKNLFELKNAQRVLVEGNVFEHSWQAGQAGYAIVLTPRNQDGRAPWSGVSDITIRSNVIRHVAGGINILGYDNEAPSAQTSRLLVANNAWLDVAGSDNGNFALIGDGATDVTFDHNTIDHTGTVVVLYGRPTDHFIFRNNLARHNAYGIIGSDRGVGDDSIAAYLPRSSISYNTFAGGDASLYPPFNSFPPTSVWEAQFVNAAAGDFRLGPASPYRGAATDGTDLGADIETLIRIATLADSGVPNPASVPIAPADLSAIVTGTTVTLRWNQAGAADFFVVECGSTPGSRDIATFATGSGATALSVDNVAPGRYYVRVRAATASGVSGPSNEVLVIVSPAG